MRAEMQLRADEKNSRAGKNFVTEELRFMKRNT